MDRTELTMDTDSATAARVALEESLYEIKRVIVGQDAMLERVLVALLVGGHVLLEGVPGLAKTLTVKTLADVVSGSFKRVQFTPDLVPADLVGTRIYRPDTGEFSVELGPVLCNFLLADEINRAPAKVQSALLEVMQERQVTIGGDTYRVPEPFLVLATQNPIESEGTYPLPEAQTDRFLMKVLVDYPAPSEEATIVERMLQAPAEVAERLSGEQLLEFRDTASRVFVDCRCHPLRGHAGRRHAPPRALRPGGHRGLHRVRGEPPRADRPRAVGEGARAPARTPPRRRERRPRPRKRRAEASPRPELRGVERWRDTR